jgi:hypothetical protein
MVLKRLALPFLMVAVALAGCSAPGPLTPEDDTVIMPLAVGNTWVGRTTTFDSDGRQIDVQYDTLRIVAEITVNNEQWFLTNRDVAYSNRNGGCWMSVSGAGVDPWMVAKYPATTLDTFNVSVMELIDQNSGAIDSLVMQSVVSSTSLRSVVPGGDFYCYQYKVDLKSPDGLPLPAADFPNRDDYSGFAPGIGPVVEEHYGAAPGVGTYLWKRWELVHMSLR